jgi:hypothetical protein
MERIIFKYLSKKYTTDVSNVGNYGIYLKNEDLDIYRSPYSGSKLCNEVTTVFGFDIPTSKIFINSWAKNVKKVNDLTFYWKYHSGIQLDFADTILPIARRASTSTINLDLVPVEPMTMPNTNLFYLDYTYNKTYDDTPKPIKEYNSKWDSLAFLDGLSGHETKFWIIYETQSKEIIKNPNSPF